MSSPLDRIEGVFDENHYAPTLGRKLVRSLQLGPKYYFWDLPRYLAFRRSLRLPPWDWAAWVNPFREFSRRVFHPLELPPGCETALGILRDAGLRISLPRIRLAGLLGVWWSCRTVPGDVIECGSYRGATSLLLALLGRRNGLNQKCLLLDTFAGMPPPSSYDGARSAGEFVPASDQVETLRQQVEKLGLQDRVELHRGLFNETFTRLRTQPARFAFAHVDANIYSGTLESCEFVLPRMNERGAVVFDDYNGVCDLGARLAIDRYFRNRPEPRKPLAGSSAFVVVKS